MSSETVLKMEGSDKISVAIRRRWNKIENMLREHPHDKCAVFRKHPRDQCAVLRKHLLDKCDVALGWILEG
jgi:hypothetical protein